MTSEQIATLPAGPALNKAIAQLLDYSVYHYDKDVEENCYFMLMDPNFDPVVGCMLHDGERKTEEEAWNDAPDFSTDIAAAWQVVEKCPGFSILHDQENGQTVYSVSLYRAHAFAETAPLAICRAALLSTL